MHREQYKSQVLSILETFSESAKSNLIKVLSLIPEKTRQITIDIFVDQDGEGFLGVRVGMDGPDLYILNRAIASHATLFETKMTENGLDPPLPLMDPFSEDFSVRDVLTDCAAEWVVSLWNQIDSSRVGIPVVVQSPEEYGTSIPVQLK